MAVPVLQCRDHIAQQLQTLLPDRVFEKAYVPEFNKELVVEGKWYIAPAGEDVDAKVRRIDSSELMLDVCYDRALPDGTNAFPDPLKNIPFLDGCMQEIETVKALFRDNGAMRELSFPYTFIKMINRPVYDAAFLFTEGVFISGVRLTFHSNT